jgi:hypothetical protein
MLNPAKLRAGARRNRAVIRRRSNLHLMVLRQARPLRHRSGGSRRNNPVTVLRSTERRPALNQHRRPPDLTDRRPLRRKAGSLPHLTSTVTAHPKV